MKTFKLGVLASGRGSNLQSIMDACARGQIPAQVAVVISDQPGALALERARGVGITAVYIDTKQYSGRADYEKQMVQTLRQHRVDLVCLAGYMRLVGAQLLTAYPMQIMNIHPALLPAFPGLDAQAQAVDYGVKYSGCTVHFVDAGMDTGPVILQAVVPVADDDTADSLADRIIKQEHQIYPRAIDLYCRGKIKVQGRKVFISE